MTKHIYLLILIFLFFSCKKEEGCMDPTALNYNSEAKKDDGSCNYKPININIEFTHTVNTDPLIKNSMIYNNQANEDYSVQTLRYLISNIILHGEDGSENLLDEVHFVDISIDSTLNINIPEINSKNYTSISFTMGLDSIKNITNLFLNESFFPSFIWPEFLGGGYHYMQLEGDFNNVLNGYATHTGATDGIDFSFNNSFPVEITKNHTNIHILINMEINNWYQNPNTIHFTTDGIMDNINQQILLQENGIDVFSVEATYN